MLKTLDISRTGFHAAPIHRAALICNAIGRAFLAVGIPNLVAIEYSLVARSDRAGGAFAGTFVTGFTERLHAKINRFVMGKRHVGYDHP